MTIIETLLQELEQEAQTTRRVLELVPDAQLGWKPHPKSMSLGQLALHVAVGQKMVCSSYACERSTTSPAGKAVEGVAGGPPHPMANSDSVAPRTRLVRINVLLERILAHAIERTPYAVRAKREGRPLPCGPLRHCRKFLAILREP